MRPTNRLSGLAFTTLALAGSAGAIQFGQVDTFQTSDTMGWAKGFNSLMPPSVISDGGPAGVGDGYLQNISTGTGSADAKQVFFNQDRWTGNYTESHITQLQAQMNNFSDVTLYMRVAMEGNSGSYISTNPTILSPHSGWQTVTFDFRAMTDLFGGSSSPLPDVLSSIFEVRILSEQPPPDGLQLTRNGDTVASTLGMDNLRALTLPGDANMDNTVNTADFNLLAAKFNQNSTDWGDGDFNSDGTVNSLDFSMLAANFGQTVSLGPPALARVVPEPVALGLLIPAAWSLKRPRHRATR